MTYTYDEIKKMVDKRAKLHREFYGAENLDLRSVNLYEIIEKHYSVPKNGLDIDRETCEAHIREDIKAFISRNNLLSYDYLDDRFFREGSHKDWRDTYETYSRACVKAFCDDTCFSLLNYKFSFIENASKFFRFLAACDVFSNLMEKVAI